MSRRVVAVLALSLLPALAAVAETLADGFLTGDLLQGKQGKHPVQSTADMGSQIAARIREI